jgi:uncharacterized protein (TIGR02594 family)
MLSRRHISLLLLSSPLSFYSRAAWADPVDPVIGQEVTFEQLTFPTFDSLDDPELQGYKRPTAVQQAKAQSVIDATPKGPTPFDIAKSFIDRYEKSDPEAISQWPAPSTWNPLVKEFFSATSLRVNNDMVDWCAAFVNWCIERNSKKGTNSAASQSFVTSGMYKKVSQPSPGNLVVFTCYEKQSGKNLGIGHVAFFEAASGSDKIRVVGGNQSVDGHSSIISKRTYLTTPFDVHRHVGGEYLPCIYKLNSFLAIA